ncbi:MAG: oligosaccharide flippase family protein [Flavobacteriales bacterium]|nr:oligosaccharide flippase family protein [Flavobacteriales bacterium]
MKKTFISNLIVLVGLNLLVKPLYLLVVEAEIQNRTGADEFGMYFALLNITFILNILTDLGLTNHNTRFIASEASIQSKQLRHMMKLRAILALIFLFTTFIAGWILQYESGQITLLLWLAIGQILSATILFLRSYLTGMHLFRHDSLISILDKLILIVLMSGLLLSHSGTFQIEWLVYGQVIAYGLTCFVAWLLISKNFNKPHDGDLPSWVQLLKESSPYATLIIISMFAYRTDTIMLERIRGSEDAGIYAMGFRFFEAVNMISYLFAVLLLPMFTRLLSTKQDVTPLIHSGLKLMFTGTWVAVLIALFFGEDLLAMIYDHHIQEANEPFFWLMISALFFSLQYITGTLITASGKLKVLIYIAIAGLIFNFSMNLIVIPTMGAQGCAISSAITQGLMFFSQVLYINIHFNKKPLIPLFLRAFIFTLLTTSPWMYTDFKEWFDGRPILALLAIGSMSLAIAYITGMLEYQSLITLLKTRFQKEETAV